MTTYAVIGTGGVGGFYGISLARSGSFVHFLIRSAADPSAPLRLESPRGTWQVTPGQECAVHRQWSDIPPVDVVIVAVKSVVNHDVAPWLHRVVKPGGAVLLVQNGVDAEHAYAAGLPQDVELAGGLAFLASHRETPNRYVHVDYGALTLGRYVPGYAAAGPGPWMQRVVQDLGRADVPVALTDDLLTARWQKLVWNIPFNGLSVLLDARTDELTASGPVRGLIADLMGEVIGAAGADGRPLPQGLAESMLAMTDSMRPYAPSMKLDFDQHRPMELDVMYRAAIARAGRAGAQMPRTGMLADALSYLDARNTAAASVR